ncbi:MAG: transporter substrate-binding domain-containing protein [Oceanospirillaceae bacterium]
MLNLFFQGKSLSKSKLFKGFFLASLLCVMAPAIAQNILRVGMPMPGQPPFLWQTEQGQVTGIYADTLREVVQDLALKLEFIPLSQARLARLFVAGEIDIEIGVPSNIQESRLLAETSIFTRSFGIANEVIIYNADLSFPAFILKDLKDKTVATVRGAVAPEYVIKENFASALQIAKRVDRGWSQVGLMREAPALHYKASNNLNYQISLPYESNLISFRLHKSRSELLRKMDLNIEKLELSGGLEDIICKYLCGN